MELMRKYSWGFAALGALCGLSFLGYWFVLGVDSTARTIGLVGVAAFLAFAFLDRDEIVEGANSRSGRNGLVSMLLVAVAFSVSVYAVKIAGDHDTRWDWTGAKRFSLAQESLDVAARIERPVAIKAFFSEGTPDEMKFKELVVGYEQANERIEVEFIDPERNPVEARQYGIVSGTGTVVLVAGDDEQRLESRFDEGALTDALVRLESGEDHLLCWAVGQGEADPDDDQDPEGFGFSVVRLEGKNYTIKKSRLAAEGIAEACELLIIARPTVDWLPNTREALAAWIAGGGRVLALLEPTTVPELASDFERYGVLLDDDIVLEDSPEHRQFNHDPSSLVLFEENFESHPIMAPLKGSVVLSVARSVTPDPEAQGVTVRRLLTSSEYAWAEVHFDDPAQLGPSEEEPPGDIGLAVAVEVTDPAALGVSTEDQQMPVMEGMPEDAELPMLPSLVPPDWTPEPGGRLVVIGDSFPGSNAGGYTGNNSDLLFNSIAWLIEEEDQLTERANEVDDQLLNLTAVQQSLVALASIFVMPGIAGFLAFITLVRRWRL